MTAKDFRKLQNELDKANVLTSINRTGRNKGRRYEVIVNMELKQKYRTRRSAKKFIQQLYVSGGG